MRLARLGPRICIFGPSNSGKSTLAVAIGAALDLEAVHIDRLYHEPNSDWKPRSEEAFVTLHDQAVAGERWVMEGNYSRLLPRRLQIAIARPRSHARYVRLFQDIDLPKIWLRSARDIDRFYREENLTRPPVGAR